MPVAGQPPRTPSAEPIRRGHAAVGTVADFSHFRERILAESENVVRLYLAGRELDQPACREQKELIESIVATDYDGRTLLEMLQNAHDAHPANAHDGRVRVVLREGEGEAGTLYVANGGQPFTDRNFTSICRLALSSKNPAEGIGNKGVGFKSALQLTDCPEIYSAASATRSRFDGYCFRFARPDDLADLAARVAPHETGLTAELRKNVASLKLPIPLDDVPAVVSAFADEGFVTVVRLPLRSDDATLRVHQQMDALLSETVPFHLFLERVSSIDIERSGGDNDLRAVRTRSVARRGAPGGVAADDVTLEDGTSYLVLRRTVPESAVRKAINASRLGSNWDEWRGDAEVQVALAAGAPLQAGRLFTFLPMATTAPVPLRAFVNGPFFAHLSRRDLEVSLPLNALLLDEMAALCAAAVVAAVEGRLSVPPAYAVDLVSWHPQHLARLLKAFDAIGHPLADYACLPAGRGTNDRTSLTDGWTWPGAGRIFSSHAVGGATGMAFIDEALGEERIRRLLELGDELGLDLRPDDDTLAEWAEALASSMVIADASAEDWGQFYDELATLFPKRTHALRGRRLLLDDRGEILPAGGEQGTELFFSPQGADEEGGVGDVPDDLRGRLGFMHPKIPWTLQRSKRDGRRWLEDHGFVREFKSEPVLRLVAKLMEDVDDEGTRHRLLAFAFGLWVTGRELPEQAVRSVGLLVPARSGWIKANSGLFSAGWAADGNAAELDALLERFIARTESASASIRSLAGRLLVAPSAFADPAKSDDRLMQFLEALGVRHGLWPIYFPARSFELTGDRVADPQRVGDFGIAAPAEHQRRWREIAATWPRRGPLYETVAYRAASPVAVLPGQFDHEAFEDDARRDYAALVLRGLDAWDDGALEFRFIRAESDPTGAPWPTILTAFLATAEWIPQTTPGERTVVTFASAAVAWWLKTADTPDYLPVQPPALRSVATAKVLSRLGRVGVRYWDDPASAAQRLDTLVELVATGSSGQRDHAASAVRKAYEQAWQDAVGGWALAAPSTLLVARGGVLGIADVTSPGAVVYVPDRAGVQQERLLAQSGVALLPIRNRTVAEAVATRLRQLGVAGLRATGEAAVDVLVDGEPAIGLPSEPLLGGGRAWVSELVAAVVESRSGSFTRVSAAQLGALHDVLRRTLLVRGSDFMVTVDGHHVQGARDANAVALHNHDKPIVVVAAPRGASSWEVLGKTSGALMDLIGFGDLGDHLELAIIKLQQLAGDAVPTTAEIASVLGLTSAELESLAVELASLAPDLTEVVRLVGALDLALGEALRAVAGELKTREALAEWLDRYRDTLGHDPSTVIGLAEGGATIDALRILGVPLEAANRAFRALNFDPLHNAAGHRRQFETYLQSHHDDIFGRVRAAFLPAFREGSALNSYLALRELDGLEPDPGWLDEHWDLDKTIMDDRVQVWLQTLHVADSEVNVLQPLHEVRETNRRVVQGIHTRAAPLVDAWKHRYAAAVGPTLPDFHSLAERMLAEGWFDFERLRADQVVAWLVRAGLWPAGMEPSLRLADVGLTDDEVTQARERLQDERSQRRRQATFISIGTKTFSADHAEYPAIAEAMRESLTADQLATPLVCPPLHEMAAGGAPRGGPGGGGGGYVPPRGSPEKTEAIGFAGEIAVGRWIEVQLGVQLEDCWVSGYRNMLLADGKGSDSGGYDFRVVTNDRILCVEVKSTTGAETGFELGESEVRRAQTVVEGEEYMVVFVQHVHDPARRRIIPLPNPLGPGGFEYYRVAGKMLRLRFELAEAVQNSDSSTVA